MDHYDKLCRVVYDERLTSGRFRVADEDGTKMEITMYTGNEDRFKGLENQEGKWVEIFRVEVRHAYPGFKATRSQFRLSAMHDTQIRMIDPLNNRHFMEFKNIHEIPLTSHMDRNYPIVVFNAGEDLDDPAGPKMVFYIRDNIESLIKCVATGDHASAFQDGFENMRVCGEVIVVLKTWRIITGYRYFGDDADQWLHTKGGLSYFMFNPCLPEVEEFRQSLLNSDTYVCRHGAIGPL